MKRRLAAILVADVARPIIDGEGGLALFGGDLDFHAVRFGVSYKFGYTPAPASALVTKY